MTSMASLAGCQALSETNHGQPVNLEALQTAWKTARQLAASYQSASEAGGKTAGMFEMVRDNHREHVKTLAKILDSSSKDGDAIEDVSAEALGEAEAKAYEEAQKLCVKAQQEHAVLLGEIAACRSAHVTLLKEA